MRSKAASRTSERTRQAVVDAAIRCLAQEGYHRATSNRIAREAGLTWGVIQYHFGDRDGIYRAVLDRVMDDYVHEFDCLAAGLSADSLDQRMEKLVESVWGLLNRPDYLATMELLVNLPRNPECQIKTKPYVTQWSGRMSGLWQGLFPEFNAEDDRAIVARQVFFAAMRGFVDNRLIGQLAGDRGFPAPLKVAVIRACKAILMAND